MGVSFPVRVLILFVLLTCVSGLDAQIVNIERQRIKTDTTGFFGGMYFSFAGSKTTKSIIAFGAGTFLEYKPRRKKDRTYNRDLWLFITDFDLVSGDNEKFTNSGFGLLRFIRKLGRDYSKLGNHVRWEVFSQIQYNGLTKIGTRMLFGTGPRFKLMNSEVSKFYFGLAYMYEYQELIEPTIFLNEHRMSSYFSFTLLPEESVTFVSSTSTITPHLLKKSRPVPIIFETGSPIISNPLALNDSFIRLFYCNYWVYERSRLSGRT